MARVFRQTYTRGLPEEHAIVTKEGKRVVRFKNSQGKLVIAPLTEAGDRIILETPNWYIDYKDPDGISRRKAGYTDRKATEQLAQQLEREAEQVRSGYRPKEHDQLSRPLADHLEDFKASLLARGTSEKQVQLVGNRASALLTNCRFKLWSDISASCVEGQLADMRTDTKEKRGISHQTSNFYLRAIKQFCGWMVKERRAPENPMAGLQGLNVQVDRRHDRRALEVEECRALVKAAMNGPERMGMPGTVRALLYKTALESGLRAGELRTLTVGRCELDAETPVLVVEAGYSKHRREDRQPIPPELAEAIRCHVEGRRDDGLVFPDMPVDQLAKMLR